MPEYTIVPLSEEHVPALAQLERLCFSAPWSEESLRAELSEPTAAFFTALWEKKIPAGYLGMQTPADEGYITNIAVFPEFRRQGVAGALLRRAAEYAADHQLRFLSLEVRPSNAAAITLYEKHGYRTVGERKNFYTAPVENARIMTLFLQEGGEKLL